MSGCPQPCPLDPLLDALVREHIAYELSVTHSATAHWRRRHEQAAHEADEIWRDLCRREDLWDAGSNCDRPCSEDPCLAEGCDR